MARTTSGLTGARAASRRAPAQLARAEQVRVAPGRRLRLIAELLERVGAEGARLRVGRIGEDEMAHGLGHEAVLASREVLAGPRRAASAPPMYSTYFRAALDRRQGIEAGRVGVVPAEIALVDRLGVVAQGAVVAAHVPGARRGSAGRTRRSAISGAFQP